MSPGPVELRPVATRRERRLFRDLPARLFGDDPAFIPMLDAAFAAVMDRKKNPFWRHAEGCEWLAWRGGQPVGRVGACHDEALPDGYGAIGFFDCGDDLGVSAALFAEACAWLRARGCTVARGPLNYSIHDTAGVLVDGHDTPPAIDTTWNPPHYGAAFEAAGFRGAQDMLGVAGTLVPGGPPRGHRFADRAKKKGATVRTLDVSRFNDEIRLFFEVYNRAWADNWGHTQITFDEFAFKAKDLKAVMDPDLIQLVEVDGRPVGCFFGLPDLNVAIKKSRGKLLPWGWLRLLRARNNCRRRNRVMILGVVPEMRRRGLEALMLSASAKAFAARYEWSEASWVLADNAVILNGLSLYGLHPYKRWRMYEKEL